MALETKINRIHTNVTAALAALAEKGVTVPTGANSDDLESLIKAIESGSGGGGSFVTGSFTPTTEGVFYFEHGLGRAPSGIVVYANNTTNLYKYELMTFLKYGFEKYVGDTSYLGFGTQCATAASSASTTFLYPTRNAPQRNFSGLWDSDEQISIPEANAGGVHFGVNKKYIYTYVLADSSSDHRIYFSANHTYHYVVW